MRYIDNMNNMTRQWGYVDVASAAVLFAVGFTLNKIAFAQVHPLIVGAVFVSTRGNSPEETTSPSYNQWPVPQGTQRQ